MTGSQFDKHLAYLFKMKEVLLHGLGQLGVPPNSFNLDASLELAFKLAETKRPDCKIVNMKDYNPCKEMK